MAPLLKQSHVVLKIQLPIKSEEISRLEMNKLLQVIKENTASYRNYVTVYALQ